MYKYFGNTSWKLLSSENVQRWQRAAKLTPAERSAIAKKSGSKKMEGKIYNLMVFSSKFN